jgi:outer membrane protein assembly factor BamE (lipoprotein component of BamABCDE complex)
MKSSSTFVKSAIAGVLMLSLGACSATYRNHGYVPTDEELSEIAVGVDTKASVEDAVGAPSAAALVREDGFYYVRSRVRNFAFLAPREIERTLVAISFDSNDVVTNIERFGLEDGNVVPLTRRVTSSGVRDTTFVRQLLGNIGRFSASNAVQ